VVKGFREGSFTHGIAEDVETFIRQQKGSEKSARNVMGDSKTASLSTVR
jgi:hypothetical protein